MSQPHLASPVREEEFESSHFSLPNSHGINLIVDHEELLEVLGEPHNAIPLVPQRTRHMITRTHDGTLKPKVYHVSKYYLPIALLSELTRDQESSSYSQAVKDPRWQQAMQEEYVALIKNNT